MLLSPARVLEEREENRRMSTRRALHFVFKIGNRHESAKFYRSILGMKTLRHEEFEEGCKASCNGPYDGKWSKTMIGYGSEDNHFVMELTYNYTVKEYKRGNDFQGITIFSKDAVANAKKHGYPMTDQGPGQYLIHAPDGYPFYLHDKDAQGDPVQKVSLGVSNLQTSVNYWHKLLGMTVVDQSQTRTTLCYDKNKCKLELVQVNGEVDHGTAFGRIAFACPKAELEGIESTMKDSGNTILTPLVSLDTPGKATVTVVILADPDGHEICFVGDESFRELSAFDPQSDKLLDEGLDKDKSEEWFAKKKAK